MTTEHIFSQDKSATPVEYHGDHYRVVVIKTVMIEKQKFVPNVGPVYEDVLMTKYDGDRIVEQARKDRPECAYCGRSLDKEYLHNGYEEVWDTWGNLVRVCRNCLVPFEIRQIRLMKLGD